MTSRTSFQLYSDEAFVALYMFVALYIVIEAR